MRVLGRVFQQGIHTLHERIGNSMLDLFGFRIHLVQRKAHDLDQKEFQQTMPAYKFCCHLLACLGQFHAMIGDIVDVATLG